MYNPLKTVQISKPDQSHMYVTGNSSQSFAHIFEPAFIPLAAGQHRCLHVRRKISRQILDRVLSCHRKIFQNRIEETVHLSW